MMHGDDSSDFTEDDEPQMAPPVKQIRFSDLPADNEGPEDKGSSEGLTDLERSMTPTSSSSTMRKPRDNKRWSTNTIQERQPTLVRPPSSRSLKSLGGRPRSSSLKQRKTKNHHMRSLSVTIGDGAPFHQNVNDLSGSEMALPTFHTDSIIDPDLAPFMSDEGSSEDEQPSIAAALSASVVEQPSGLPHGLMGVLKRTRSSGPGKALNDTSRARGDSDNISIMSSRIGKKRRQLGARTISMGSLPHLRFVQLLR